MYRYCTAVAESTLRRWEPEGKINSERTKNGHRRYDVATLLGPRAGERKTIGYACISSSEQTANLDRQIMVLEAYCNNQGWLVEIIRDLGSGINYRKRGLVRLIKMICSEKVERLVLTNKDRLVRFGAELIFTICEIFGTEIVIINDCSESTEEEYLERDILEIIKIFTARLYGSRSKKNKK
ncbi:IS607 family transposase [Hydrocoleum sp. CS-953]|uniref:IS607 family transposase n=1 Tax=Hydrocoleum sp. CS-953 TaxID=1671698 RepID=UPI001FEE9CBC|nr:IS607 family transposase [Hydrocoleum sp. CS-953]